MNTSKTYAQVYDGLVEDAVRQGVCPKVVSGRNCSLDEFHACGRPLMPGTRWCDRHQR